MEENLDHTNARILIVDDNPKNLQVLGGSLRSNNYDVEFSTSGKGALEWLNNEEFDLILLDVMMPEMDGFETCTKIRSELNNKEVPIIFLTAKTDRESILNAFQVGAQDFITKPFDSKELLARVETHLELKFARQKLKNLNENLEQKVAERTLQLNIANKELADLDRVKGEFLNMLSHEIRTPLNGIKGSLQLLKVRIDNEELVQLIDILDSSVTRLEDFSYTALLITRLKSKKFNIENSLINLRNETDFALLPINAMLTQKEIQINTDDLLIDLLFETDKDLFHELLKRIFDNAVRYSPDGGIVRVISDEDDEKITIKIVDNGNGFPSKILTNKLKLFNPGETHVNKNMGLNLYLSSLIMNYLGGTMDIANNPEKGACVVLTFIK